MRRLHIIGMVVFALLVVAGLATASGLTGNIIASSGRTAPAIPQPLGYTVSLIGLGGIFAIWAFNKRVEDFY